MFSELEKQYNDSLKSNLNKGVGLGFS